MNYKPKGGRYWFSRGMPLIASQTLVKRGGKQNWSGQTKEVEINVVNRSGSNRAIGISYVIPSKGGGDTYLSVRIGPKDFRSLLQAMSVVDRQAAILAMCTELSYELAVGLDVGGKN